MKFHFIPTSASWLNLVERFFSELTQRQLKRLAVTSVRELTDAITAYIDDRNRAPAPFKWTAAVEDILAKVSRANATLATLHWDGPRQGGPAVVRLHWPAELSAR